MGVATYKGVPIVWQKDIGWVKYEIAHGRGFWECVKMIETGERPDPVAVQEWLEQQC